ncbi:hypothetical protein Tco_1399871 [Tanacetum coccineum]
MASLDYRLNPLFTIKECSSCGSLYNKGYCCTPDSSQQPLHDCPKCGNPVEGPNCQGCALWRKKLKEVWFTICHENGIYQDLLNTYESSDDDTNIANAPRKPFVVKQDPEFFLGNQSQFTTIDLFFNGGTMRSRHYSRKQYWSINNVGVEDLVPYPTSESDGISEVRSLEVVEIAIPEVGGIDTDILLTIKDDIFREKLLNVNLLIANIEALKDNSTPSSDFVTKSPSTFPNFFLEETNTFDNSLPESKTFCFNLEEISSGSTTTRSDYSLPDYEALYLNDDHIEEKSSGSTTTNVIFSQQYDSFILSFKSTPFLLPIK